MEWFVKRVKMSAPEPAKRKRKSIKHVGSVLDPHKTVSIDNWEKAIYGAKKQMIKGGGHVKWKPKEVTIKQIIPLMCMLSQDLHGNESQRKALIDHMTNKQMSQISKFMRDFLHQKTTVPPEILKALRKDREDIEHLADVKISKKKKQERLKQNGGFLPLLALGAMPFINVLAKSVLEPLGKAAVNAIVGKMTHKPAHQK